MFIRQDAPEPVYKQLRELFLQRLQSGELAPGDKISTENTLADQFKVSRTTIRRALRGLECDGLIVRFPGKGTFINLIPGGHKTQHYTVGVNFFSSFRSHHYYGQVMDGILEEAERKNVHIQVLPRDLVLEEADHLDGLIFTGKPNPDSELYRKAAKGILPAIGFNSRLSAHTDFIGIDNAAEACKGVSWLIRKGFRKIGFYGTHPADRQSPATQRFQGYCDALKANGMEINMRRVHFLELNNDSYQQAMDFFHECDSMDALFVSLGPVLKFVLYAMNRMHISTEELPLLCFDNLEAIDQNWPGIAYIRMPLQVIGESLLNAVRQKILLKERAPAVNEIFQAEIVFSDKCESKTDKRMELSEWPKFRSV